MTVTEFVAQHNINITSEWADSNPNNPEWHDANHYKVTLTRKDDGKQKRLTVYFSQGYGIKEEPEADSVLNALALDSSGFENARSFEEWASEYGYDPDSRKAERIYKACEKAAEKLKKFLGPELYESLLWNTESL